MSEYPKAALLLTALCGTLIFNAGCLSTEAPNEEEKDPVADPIPKYFDAERILLHEVYSGSNCGPCKPADELIHDILDDNPDEYSVIHYQVGSDPYMSYESVGAFI